MIVAVRGWVEHHEGGVFGGELAAVAGDLAQPGVHGLNQVRRIDHPADLERERQERGELLAVRPPQPDDRWVSICRKAKGRTKARRLATEKRDLNLSLELKIGGTRQDSNSKGASDVIHRRAAQE
jgi:hypothetical protein